MVAGSLRLAPGVLDQTLKPVGEGRRAGVRRLIGSKESLHRCRALDVSGEQMGGPDENTSRWHSDPCGSLVDSGQIAPFEGDNSLWPADDVPAAGTGSTAAGTPGRPRRDAPLPRQVLPGRLRTMAIWPKHIASARGRSYRRAPAAAFLTQSEAFVEFAAE